MSKKKNRPHGHYCKICGEYKANEKFSGKGHAAHICKEDGVRYDLCIDSGTLGTDGAVQLIRAYIELRQHTELK